MKTLYTLCLISLFATTAVFGDSCELSCEYDEFFGAGWMPKDSTQCPSENSFCAPSESITETCEQASDFGKTVQSECVTFTPPPPPSKLSK